jgi:hypothetical protein
MRYAMQGTHNSAQRHKRAIVPQARRSHLSNPQACHSTRPGKKMEDDVAHATVAQPHRLRTRLAWNQNANCYKIKDTLLGFQPSPRQMCVMATRRGGAASRERFVAARPPLHQPWHGKKHRNKQETYQPKRRGDVHTDCRQRA